MLFLSPVLSLWVLLISAVRGRVLLVDPVNGSDSNSGLSETLALRSLQHCVLRLRGTVPGESATECRLRGGEYFFDAPVLVEHLKGSRDAPYVIGAYRDEIVTIIGTKDVVGSEWEWVPGSEAPGAARAGHWATTLAEGIEDPWQLFVDKEMFVNARWPDARWDTKSMFYARNWAHGTADSVYTDTETEASTIVVEGDALAASGLNLTGASAVLNIGHWFTFAAPVAAHEPGSNAFNYFKQPGWRFKKYRASHDLFYLENKLELVSNSTEWFYDRALRRLHVCTRGGAGEHPSKLRIMARVQEYALRLSDVRYVTLHGLHFLGTTVWAGAGLFVDEVVGVRLDSCRFEHPATMKRMLGDHRHSWPTTIYQKDVSTACYNAVVNCTFTGSEAGPLMNVNGAGIRIEQSAFEWNDWSAVTTVPCWPGGGGGIGPGGTLAALDPALCDATKRFGGGSFALAVGAGTATEPTIIRRNTIAHFGPSAGVKVQKNTLVELNHIHDHLDIQLDGAMIQGGGHDLYEIGERSEPWRPTLCADLAADADACAALDGCAVQGEENEECAGLPLRLDAPPEEALNGSARYGTVYLRNWVHDALNERTSKRGLRFDRAQDTCHGRWGNTWPVHGEMRENVVWRTAGVMVKGNANTLVRNTIFGSAGGPDGGRTVDDEGSTVLARMPKSDLRIRHPNPQDVTMYDELAEGTCTCAGAHCVAAPTQCCVVLANGTELGETFEGRLNLVRANALGSFKGIVGGGGASASTASVDAAFGTGAAAGALVAGNAAGVLDVELRDRANWDFRPVGGGAFDNAQTGAYSLAAPDQYWIPGRQSYRASTPVPPHGARGVRRGAALMYLHAAPAAAEYRVYAACSPAQLEALAATGAAGAACVHRGASNVCAPPAELMRPGRTVFWRVDTVLASGAVYAGEAAWSFELEDVDAAPAAPAPPARCTTWRAADVPAALPESGPSAVVDVAELSVPSGTYPAAHGWRGPTEARVCVDLEYATGVGELQLRLKRPSTAGFAQLSRLAGGAASQMRAVCFAPGATDALPAGEGAEALAPFSGSWRPTVADTSIAELVEGLGDGGGVLRLAAKLHASGARGPGSVSGFSLELCYEDDGGVRVAWEAAEAARLARVEAEAALPWCETPAPTTAPTSVPTAAPTGEPTTAAPTTAAPTRAPTPIPAVPTVAPTSAPTTGAPTVAPTPLPSTLAPSLSPTASPTVAPTVSPTVTPTVSPTMSPTMSPTVPTASPTASPTLAHCANGVVDEGETDRDCGGADCARCAVGRRCELDGDCDASARCAAGQRCVATLAPTNAPTLAPTPAPTPTPSLAPSPAPTRTPTTAAPTTPAPTTAAPTTPAPTTAAPSPSPATPVPSASMSETQAYSCFGDGAVHSSYECAARS